MLCMVVFLIYTYFECVASVSLMKDRLRAGNSHQRLVGEQGWNYIHHYSIHSSLWHSFPDCFPLVAEWFEEDNDPEACLDEFSGENHKYVETETSTGALMFPSQGNDSYTNYTLNSEFPTHITI